MPSEKLDIAWIQLTFKLILKYRVSIASTEDVNTLQAHRIKDGVNDSVNSFSAAFLDFRIPETLTSALCGKSDTKSIQSTNSANSKGIVFVPCSLDSDVAGSYTLTIYSTVQLSWKSAPLSHLLNPVEPCDDSTSVSKSSSPKRKMHKKKKSRSKIKSEMHEDFWKEADDEDSVRETFSLSSDELGSDLSDDYTGAQHHDTGINSSD